MTFYIKLLAEPYGTPYWRPIIYHGAKPYYPPDDLPVRAAWACPLSAPEPLTVDFRCVLYDANGKRTAIRDLYGVTVRDKVTYAYDWQADTFKPIIAPPPPVEEYTITLKSRPIDATLSKSPDKPRYVYGEKVSIGCEIPVEYYYVYEFDYWTVGGEFYSRHNPFTLHVVDNHRVIAYLKELEEIPPPPPPPPPPIGVVEKTPEVHAWLAKLNWIILGFEIPLGDTVEYALDLAIGLINTAIGLAQEARNIAEGIKGELTDRIDQLGTAIDGWLARLDELRKSIPDIVDNWWQDIKPDVLDWIDARTKGLADLKAAWDNFWTVTWPGLINDLEGLRASWDNFRRYTLPGLVNVGWITDWWSGKSRDIDGWITGAFTARDDLWRGWQEQRDNVIQFFTDPVEFIWARFTDWFLGGEV